MVKHIRWQILLVILGTILAGVLLSRQSVDLEEIFVPASGGVLIEGVVGLPQDLNPLLNFDNPVDRDICSLIFEGLVKFDEKGQLVPNLATGWNVSLDGLVYTFWLRQDVRWQDGEIFSADDVLFTYQLLQDEGYPGPADLIELWQSVVVEKVNRWTITITLSEPFAPFLEYATIGLLPAHVLDGVSASELVGNRFNRDPVGTGPFKVESGDWEGGRLSLSANLLYREKRPQLSGVEFSFFPNSQGALEAFERGQVHTVSNLPYDSIAQAKEIKDLDLFTSSLPRVTMLLLNLESDDLLYFREKNTRKALLYGVDRAELIAQVLDGQAVVASSPIYPDSWAYYGELEPYAYAPDHAAALLDSGGWVLPKEMPQDDLLLESEDFPDGVRARAGDEISFTILTTNDAMHQAVAANLAAQWAKIGIRVMINAVEPSDLFENLENGQFEAALVDVDMRGDPDLYALWSESAIAEGQNYGGWRNREASQLLEDARQLTNLGQRTTRYYRFQQVFVEQVPSLLLFYHTYTYGVSSQIQKVSLGPLTSPSDRFTTINDWFLVWREVIIRKSQ